MSKLFHSSFFAMGTRCHVVLPGHDEDSGEQIFAVIKEEIKRVESSLSRFIPYSEISIINKNAAMQPVTISREICDILQTCMHYYEQTRGAFDISMRPLLEYWKKKSSNEQADLQLYEKMDAIGMNLINLDIEQQTVSFENSSIEIDLGGFGKGYALERCRTLLQDFSVENAFISFGESSVLTLGRHPAGDYWKVGLNNYSRTGEALHTFYVNEGSVSTSSNFFVNDEGAISNHRHVINPFTGYPIEKCITASVCSESPITAEVLSTAFLVAAEENIRNTKNIEGAVEIVKVDYTGDEPEMTIF